MKARNTQTGIHTRISDRVRISSAFRHYGNDYFSSWGWETFVWDGDKIIEEHDVINDADAVVKLHTNILKEHGKFVQGVEL